MPDDFTLSNARCFYSSKGEPLALNLLIEMLRVTVIRMIFLPYEEGKFTETLWLLLNKWKGGLYIYQKPLLDMTFRIYLVSNFFLNREKHFNRKNKHYNIIILLQCHIVTIVKNYADLCHSIHDKIYTRLGVMGHVKNKGKVRVLG